MGISNYDTVAANNTDASPNGSAEGMAPSTVNNVQRQRQADIRTQWNSAEWFEFRDGTPIATTLIVYVSSSSFKITGADATAYWHVGRRVKIVDISPLTTYATITATSFAAGATTVTIDSTALTNVDLTAYASTIPSVNTNIPGVSITGVDYTFEGGIGGGIKSVGALSTNGDFAVYGSAAGGITLQGKGSVNDFTIRDDAGNQKITMNAAGDLSLLGGLTVAALQEVILNLPTSAGTAGSLWNDTGTVKVA